MGLIQTYGGSDTDGSGACIQYKAGIKTVATFPTFVGVKMRGVSKHAAGTIVNSFVTAAFSHWPVFCCTGHFDRQVYVLPPRLAKKSISPTRASLWPSPLYSTTSPIVMVLHCTRKNRPSRADSADGKPYDRSAATTFGVAAVVSSKHGFNKGAFNELKCANVHSSSRLRS